MKTKNVNLSKYVNESLDILNKSLKYLNEETQEFDKTKEMLIKKSKLFLNQVKEIEDINAKLKELKTDKNKINNEILNNVKFINTLEQTIDQLEPTIVDTISYTIKISDKESIRTDWTAAYKSILDELNETYKDLADTLKNIKKNCDRHIDKDEIEQLKAQKIKFTTESTLLDIDTMIPTSSTNKQKIINSHKKELDNITALLTKVNIFINDSYLINQVLDNLFNLEDPDENVEEFTADDFLNEDFTIKISIENDKNENPYKKSNITNFDDYIQKQHDDEDDEEDDEDNDDDEDNIYKHNSDHYDDYVYERKFNTAERQKLAKEGKALPDGSFPIVTIKDLKNAIRTIGRSSDRVKAQKHIIKRAKELNALDLIPDDWK